jgi:hypothetical protein
MRGVFSRDSSNEDCAFGIEPDKSMDWNTEPVFFVYVERKIPHSNKFLMG